MAKNHKPRNYLKILILLFVGICAVIFVISITLEMSNEMTKPSEVKILSGSFDENKFKSDEEWKEILTSEQYHILREKGTDIPFTKSLTDNKEKGTYISIGCEEPVFTSADKFDSKTGWPSFTKPISENAIVLQEDYELGYKRIEVLDKCGNHLGHVFEDGPEPTGLRYCINATALRFIPEN